MYTDCDRIIRLTIPAIRIAVARRLKKDYGMSQADIAMRLGIAQAAVSKYLHKRFSPSISKLASTLENDRTGMRMAAIVASTENFKAATARIDRFATSKFMVQMAQPLL